MKKKRPLPVVYKGESPKQQDIVTALRKIKIGQTILFPSLATYLGEQFYQDMLRGLFPRQRWSVRISRPDYETPETPPSGTFTRLR